MIDIIYKYEKPTDTLQWTKVGCGTHLPCQDTNPSYLLSSGWMDGSPSTQIRINIKKNKREREGAAARARRRLTDRQTDGDKKGER